LRETGASLAATWSRRQATAHRMVMDYVKSSYLTAAGGVCCDMSIR